MATRKDLLKAHSFTTRRLVSSLVDRDPDAPHSPLSRITTATFVSVLIGVVALAGSMLLGKLKPGQATDWAKGGQVIQDLDSGNLFVYLQNANKLEPMANITSARLAAAQSSGEGGSATTPPTVQVRGKLLKSMPRAPRRGIPGAPYELPAKADMTPFPLRSCVSAPQSNGARFITIEINNFTASPDSWAIAVETPNHDQYIVLQGVAHKLWKKAGDGASPLIEGLPLARVPDAWLQALPLGQPIVPSTGVQYGAKPSKGPSQLTIGDVVSVGRADSPDVRYYIQLDNGLVRISYLDMKLAMATRGINEPSPISEADLSQYAAPSAQFGTPGLPFDKPVGPPGVSSLDADSICATWTSDDSEHPRITVGVQTPALPPAIVNPKGNRADLVSMPNMSGALLMNQALQGTSSSSFLIYNSHSFPIPDANSRTALGYDKDTPIGRVPAGLIALFEPGLSAGKSLSASSIEDMP